MSDEGFIEALKERLVWYEQKAHVIRELLAAEGHSFAADRQSHDFAGLGIVQATERLLRESGHPMPTSEIAARILGRGVTTTSERFVPTVYATLDNSPRFERIGSGRAGRWRLATLGGQL